MTGVVRVKPGVLFTTIAPGGFRILAELERCARIFGQDLTITSACDGVHSGPADPHHRGEAYDIRTHGFTHLEVENLLTLLQHNLGDGFFAFLEAPGTTNEHIHAQVKKGQTYP